MSTFSLTIFPSAYIVGSAMKQNPISEAASVLGRMAAGKTSDRKRRSSRRNAAKAREQRMKNISEKQLTTISG